jgi:Tfp pilus assembly protein PilP|tara:strand:+ start:1027 stop:1215 length:189 start_codon:yes stop_codon:yes gene_type:complete
MSLKDMKNYIAALEKSVNEDIQQLKKMQEVNTKFLDMQSTKENIFRKQRQISKLAQEIKNAR